MRCDDLTRELASPTGGFAQAEMAGHLAACPACAEWSRRAAHFDQIWGATRPTEPTPEALDNLWARASVELEYHKAPSKLKFAQPHRRRRWVVAAFAVAQAAVLLIAGLILLRADPDNKDKRQDMAVVEPIQAEPELLEMNVEENVVATVRIDKANHVRVDTDDLSKLYDSSSLPVGTLKDLADEAETKLPFSSILASSQ
jgi:hypothetical protein